MKRASVKDRQLCARTKVPEDEARVISVLAQEHKLTEYEMIRRLLRLGMWALCCYNKRYANKPDAIQRVRDAAKVSGSECPWFFSLEEEQRSKLTQWANTNQ